MNPNASLHDIPLPSDSQYRRAQRLLKHYRDYSWQLKIAVFQASEMTGIPFTDRTEEFIQIFRQKAAEDIDGQLTSLWHQISVLSTVLSSLEHFSSLIRRYHPNGELYYWILNYTYFAFPKPECTEEILAFLAPHCSHPLPIRSYFRKRRQAVELMAILISQMQDLPFAD